MRLHYQAKGVPEKTCRVFTFNIEDNFANNIFFECDYF